MGLLNTNMTGLNISYAAQLIQNENKFYGKRYDSKIDGSQS